MNETINLIKNHRSIRTYLEKNISDDILDEILKAVHSMPTSINGQQVSVIVVRVIDNSIYNISVFMILFVIMLKIQNYL